jgi:hypothetical protein
MQHQVVHQVHIPQVVVVRLEQVIQQLRERVERQEVQAQDVVMVEEEAVVLYLVVVSAQMVLMVVMVVTREVEVEEEDLR